MNVSVGFDWSVILHIVRTPTYLRRLQLQRSIFRRRSTMAANDDARGEIADSDL